MPMEPEATVDTVAVLTKEYYDQSAYEVVRVYEEPARAREDYDLVKDDSMMKWKLRDVPIIRRERTGA